MKEAYTNIVRNLKDDSSALQLVQKLLTTSIGERDFFAKETCHLLLQLPLVKLETMSYLVLMDLVRLRNNQMTVSAELQ